MNITSRQMRQDRFLPNTCLIVRSLTPFSEVQLKGEEGACRLREQLVVD
jgi:hypothetical protein